MIKKIITDQFILSQKSTEASLEDVFVAYDLLDTLKANEDRCVGMAANMIGVLKNIIVVKDGQNDLVMFNPVILKLSGKTYIVEEGCLSHKETHSVKRYEKVKIKYNDFHFKTKIKTFEGLTAQIIQHEIDHCMGILV